MGILMGITKYVFVGIRGSVVALDRNSGEVLWETHLNGDEFVNLVLADTYLYATTRGELFCLEPFTGRVRWGNSLKGFGNGVASIAAAGMQAPPVGDIYSAVEAAERRHRSAATTDTIFID